MADLLEDQVRRVGVFSAPADDRITGLLCRLLEFHGIQVHREPAAMPPPSPEPATPQAMVMVLSKQSEADQAFLAGANRFAGQPFAKRLIFSLDEANPAGAHSLGSGCKVVCASDSLVGGFEVLFEELGHLFLDPARALTPRAENRRRIERRSASVRQRLRKGFWLAYHRATGAGEFDLLPLSSGSLVRIQDHLRDEAQRYRYVDPGDGNDRGTDAVLTEALEHVCYGTPRQDSGAVYVIEAVAEHIWNRYLVEPRDRRRLGDRRDDAMEEA